MQYLDNIIFFVLLVTGLGLFARSLQKIYRNIGLGRKIDRTDHPAERWKTMATVALGQSKMKKRPIAAFLHLLVYVGFLIINMELVEIIIDGIFGTHRVLASVIGDTAYGFFTATLEVLALLVVIAVVAFFIRRNFLPISRLSHIDLKGWAKQDANWILIIEFLMMMAFFKMNAADYQLQKQGVLAAHGSFPISDALFGGIFSGFSPEILHFIERGSWWFHFVGIMCFMNYLYYSKHLHIMLAFPNTWFANLEKKGEFNNLASVTQEIKLMMDPNADPYAAPAEGASEVPEKFGASDVFDLHGMWTLYSSLSGKLNR
jgi:hypothetical protein